MNVDPNNSSCEMHDDATLAQRLADSMTFESAAIEVWNRHFKQLFVLARRNMSNILNRRVDPDDVMQLAFLSFYRRAKTKEYLNLNDGELFAILHCIVICKACNEGRFHTRGKRDVRREESASSKLVEKTGNKKLANLPACGSRSLAAQNEKGVQSKDAQTGRVTAPSASNIVQSDPSTTSALNLEDSVSLFRRSAKDKILEILATEATPEQAAILVETVEAIPETFQTLLLYYLEGRTDDEIAEKIKKSRRTVVRKKTGLRKYLTVLLQMHFADFYHPSTDSEASTDVSDGNPTPI